MPRPSHTIGIGDSLRAKKGPTAAAPGLRWTLLDRSCVAMAAFHAVEAREAPSQWHALRQCEASHMQTQEKAKLGQLKSGLNLGCLPCPHRALLRLKWSSATSVQAWAGDQPVQKQGWLLRTQTLNNKNRIWKTNWAEPQQSLTQGERVFMDLSQRNSSKQTQVNNQINRLAIITTCGEREESEPRDATIYYLKCLGFNKKL